MRFVLSFLTVAAVASIAVVAEAKQSPGSKNEINCPMPPSSWSTGMVCRKDSEEDSPINSSAEAKAAPDRWAVCYTKQGRKQITWASHVFVQTGSVDVYEVKKPSLRAGGTNYTYVTPQQQKYDFFMAGHPTRRGRLEKIKADRSKEVVATYDCRPLAPRP